MSKILISWVAVNNDFIKETKEVNPDGPTSLIHKDFYEYDYHILLSNNKEGRDLPYEFLINFLKRTYKHDIREKYLVLNDVINVKEIKEKVENLLLEHRNDEIDIFISSGTPSMQVAWYLAHWGLSLKTRLFQIRPGKFTDDKLPKKIYIDLEISDIPKSLMLKEIISNDCTDADIIITDSLKPIYKLAEKVSATDNVPVLILGQTGTGKEKLARYIHDKSSRGKGNYIAINCASLGDQLLESRLFGYEKGAFTGASQKTSGYFHHANGGTIFLDEIGDITPYMQKTLLRVLQEQKITRVGSTVEEKIDVRIISATNKDLLKFCQENKFRFDLYYRLSTIDLKLPSLQQMGIKEMEKIFYFMLNKYKIVFNRAIPMFSKEIKEMIFSYSFPGNIREIQNLVCRLYTIADEVVLEENLPDTILQVSKENSLKLADITSKHINTVYLMCDKNVSKTAKVLDISINSVKKHIVS